MPVRAYIDESMRQRKEDDCVYVLAAALVEDDDADDVRDTLKRLRYRKNPTIHWYEEHPNSRAKLTAAMAELPMRALIAIDFYEHRKDERARRRCLEALWNALAEREVISGEVSSRCPSQDRLDLELLQHLRRRGLPHDLRMDWIRYAEEPLLWAGDVFASAIGWSFDGDSVYADALDCMITYLDTWARERRSAGRPSSSAYPAPLPCPRGTRPLPHWVPGIPRFLQRHFRTPLGCGFMGPWYRVDQDRQRKWQGSPLRVRAYAWPRPRLRRRRAGFAQA
jgi:hypothetical protein